MEKEIKDIAISKLPFESHTAIWKVTRTELCDMIANQLEEMFVDFMGINIKCTIPSKPIMTTLLFDTKPSRSTTTDIRAFNTVDNVDDIADNVSIADVILKQYGGATSTMYHGDYGLTHDGKRELAKVSINPNIMDGSAEPDKSVQWRIGPSPKGGNGIYVEADLAKLIKKFVFDDKNDAGYNWFYNVSFYDTIKNYCLGEMLKEYSCLSPEEKATYPIPPYVNRESIEYDMRVKVDPNDSSDDYIIEIIRTDGEDIDKLRSKFKRNNTNNGMFRFSDKYR